MKADDNKENQAYFFGLSEMQSPVFEKQVQTIKGSLEDFIEKMYFNGYDGFAIDMALCKAAGEHARKDYGGTDIEGILEALRINMGQAN
jgi:hypothetical protein